MAPHPPTGQACGMQRTRLLPAVAAATLAIGAVVGVACGDDGADPGARTTTSEATGPTTTTTTLPATGKTIIVSGSVLVGWWDGSRWLDSEAGAPTHIAGGEDYTVVRLDQPLTTSRGSAVGPQDEFCTGPKLTLSPGFPDSSPGQPWPVAVHGVADPRPRPVTLLDTSADAYRDAARDVLADLGIEEDDPQLAQVVRADLSGDGSDDVLVVVEQIADPRALFAQPGDYSAAFLRQVVDGEVRTTTIAHDRSESTPDVPSAYIVQTRIAALADLNGDGVLEVVVDHRYYEGSSTEIHALDSDGRLKAVMAAGCGV